MSDSLQPTDLIYQLKELREEASVILKERGLVGSQGGTPKSTEVGFSDDSFDKLVSENILPKHYTAWQRSLNDLFDRASLDYILFEHSVKSEVSVKADQPSSVFVGMVNELNRIISDERVLMGYEMTSQRSSSWPVLTYEKGVVRQGLDKKYTLSRDLNVRFFDLMWDDRRILSPMLNGHVIKNGNPITREELFKRLNISNKERLNDIIDAVSKSGKAKNMNIRVRSPDSNSVYIEVIQEFKSDRP